MCRQTGRTLADGKVPCSVQREGDSCDAASCDAAFQLQPTAFHHRLSSWCCSSEGAHHLDRRAGVGRVEAEPPDQEREGGAEHWSEAQPEVIRAIMQRAEGQSAFAAWAVTHRPTRPRSACTTARWPAPPSSRRRISS